MKYAQPSSTSPWAAVTCVLCSLSLIHTCSCYFLCLCRIPVLYIKYPGLLTNFTATVILPIVLCQVVWCINTLVYRYLVLLAFLLESHLTLSTFFLIHFNLWLPFFFFNSHTFAHIYSLTFPFLSYVVSIMPKNHSSFSMCIFFNCHFSGKDISAI